MTTTDPRPDPRPTRRQDGGYPSLLDQVLGSALEPEYETVARRRAAEAAQAADAAPGSPADPATSVPAATGASGRPDRGGSRAWLGSVVVVAVFALLVGAALRETRADAPTDALVRETLVREAGERRDELATLQQEVAAVRRSNGELSSELREVRAARADAVAELRRVAAAAGFQQVTGTGVRWTVQNAPASAVDPLVTANDLALLVNGLWEAGAEAVAVNGQRLTARSAITQSGAGINVNSTPLTAPFVVSAIGDQRTLESLFAETRSGFLWLLTVDSVGFRTEVAQVDDLFLPAAPERLLRTCEPCYPVEPVRPGGPSADR